MRRLLLRSIDGRWSFNSAINLDGPNALAAQILVMPSASAREPVLVIEFEGGWKATVAGPRIDLSGRARCALAGRGASTDWSLTAGVGSGVTLSRVRVEGFEKTNLQLAGMQDVEIGSWSRPDGTEINEIRHFLVEVPMDEPVLGPYPLRRGSGTPIALALVRCDGSGPVVLAFSAPGKWRSVQGRQIAVRRGRPPGQEQPPLASDVIAYNRDFYPSGQIPDVLLVQTLHRDRRSPEVDGIAVYRQGLTIARTAGSGFLGAWSRGRAAPLRARYEASKRVTFVPEIVSPDPLRVEHSGEWAMVALRGDDDYYRLVAAQPTARAAGTLEIRLRGVKPHTGELPAIPVRVHPITPVAGGIGSLARAASAFIEYKVSEEAEHADLAFQLLGEPVVPAAAAASTVGASAASGSTASASAAAPVRLRIDEFDLDIKPVGDTESVERPFIRVSAGSPDGFLSPVGTRYEIDAIFSVTRLQPGGDGLVGRQSSDDDVHPALVVPLRAGESAELLDLQVKDTWRRGAVDTKVTAALIPRRQQRAAGEKRRGVALVIGNRPSFLLGVTYEPLVVSSGAAAGNQSVASWVLDPNPAPGQGQRGWRPGEILLLDDKSSFGWSVLLPAQGIGEETERAGTLHDRANVPIDFRIGEPARLDLSVPTTVPGVNRLFPWNAFRAFLDPAAGSPDLVAMHVELLFGMPCDYKKEASDGAFVVMDPVRRLGFLTIPRPAKLAWLDQTVAHASAYRVAKERWDSQRSHYTSRTLLLEPVDQSQLAQWNPVVLRSPRVTCTLYRPPVRDMRIPVDSVATDSAEAARQPSSLRGGAAWGVEQAPVYRALFGTGTQRDTVGSADAILSGLSLSSFGGSGHVAAGFRDLGNTPEMEPGTRIAADVSYGRLTRYLVTRRGRIGVFGHPALHVVVYERTTAGSDQFGALQPRELQGRAIVRKVEEYVEIPDPVRRFSDEARAAGAAAAAAAATAAGVVTGCAFQPGARIHVRSDWGREVGSLGWKVPLWSRAAAAAQPTVYPRPDVALLLATEQTPTGGAGRPADRACAIQNPDILCFFTRTDGADPGSPLPVEGVDFATAPVPEPQRPRKDPQSPAADSQRPEGDPEKLMEMLADDPEVPRGFESFTYRIDPGDEPVMVSANRGTSTEGVRARLHTLTVVRGPTYERTTLPVALREWESATREIGTLGDRVEQSGTALVQMAEAILAASGASAATLLRQAVAGDAIAWPQGTSDEVKAFVERARGRYRQGFAEVEKIEQRVRELRKERFVAAADASIAMAKTQLDEQLGRAREKVEKQLRIIAERVPSLMEEARSHATFANPDAAIAAYRMAVAGVWTLLEVVDPDQVRLEIERAALAYLELSDAWVRAARMPDLDELDKLDTVGSARAWLGDMRRRATAIAMQLSAGRATWLQIIGPVIAEVESRVVASLSTLEARLSASYPPQDFRDAIFAEATALRQLVHRKLILLASSAIDPPEGAAVTGFVRGRLELEHVLRKRLDALRLQSEGRIRGWTYPLPKEPPPADRLAAELKWLVSELSSNLLAAETSFVDEIRRQARELLGPISTAAAQAVEVAHHLKDLEAQGRQHLKGLLESGKQVEQAVREARDAVRSTVQSTLVSVNEELRPYLNPVAQAQSGVRLLRALGEPPTAQELAFVQSRLAYVFPANDPRTIKLSTTVARVGHLGRQLGAVNNQIKALGIDLPVTELRDALLAPARDLGLDQLDFNKIFKDLAGLKLDGLFPDLKFPREVSDAIKIRHELDPATRRVRVHATVDMPLGEAGKDTPIFDIGVLAIALRSPRINAHISMTGAPPPIRQEARGEIVADWVVTVAGTPMVILRQTRIRFAQPGGLSFDIDPTRIELADAVRFVTELLAQASPEAAGLVAGLIDRGFEAVLSSEIPMLAVGTATIMNLSLGIRFALERDDRDYAIVVGAFVGRRSAPFAITVFILGGGGFLEVDARYVVGGRITCAVSLGINAAAAVGIALGPIRGSVFAALGFALHYRSGQGGGLRFEIYFLLRGTVVVLSLISVVIELGLSLTYGRGGRFVGTGTFRCTIKIGFFKKRISKGIRYELGCVRADEAALAGHHRQRPVIAPATFDQWAVDYVSMYV